MDKSVDIGYGSSKEELNAMELTGDGAFKVELRNMILTADSSIHDILKYKLDYAKLETVWTSIKEEECFIEYNAYGNIRLVITEKGKFINTLKIEGIDDDYFSRLKRMKKMISTIVLGIDRNMTDLEKALYVHDFIVENTVFRQDNSFCYKPSGPLGYGYGVCSGYTEAFMFIMKLLNIEASYITSRTMNHRWAYVCLDGEWYHIDLTWDDTLSPVEGETYHDFFIRNDKEFTDTVAKKHYNWYNPIGIASTSNKYCDLFVHDVVGKLFYQNGFWYYYKPEINSIVRNRIDGSDYKILVDGSDFSESIKILSVNSTQIECLINNQKVSIGI